MKRTAALIILTGIVLTGCTPLARPTTTATESETPTRTEVDWSTYPSNYQKIIDEDTQAGDCDALQETFDAAPNDAELLTYLDEALRLADCY